MISIVVPVYNEEEMLPSFINVFFKQINLKEKYELIFVNDGSTDNTEKIIKKAMGTHEEIRLISYFPNKNLGYALPVGFRASKGRIVVTMDSDLVHPPRIISKLVQRIDEGYDLAIGSRYLPGAGVKGVPLLSDFLSKLINYFTRFTILSKIKDATTGFRAYNRKITKTLKTKEIGFEVQLEILVNLMKNGIRISEIPFRSEDRKAGESKLNLFKHGPNYISGLFRIFVYRWF